MSRRCKQFNRTANLYNPRRGGLALNYFGPNCGDPYTTLSYWYRRFKSQDCYLSEYFVPSQKYARQFGASRPYRRNGFSYGNICPVLYLGPRKNCPTNARGTAVCGAGPVSKGYGPRP